jgi:predicted dehydrogenase
MNPFTDSQSRRRFLKSSAGVAAAAALPAWMIDEVRSAQPAQEARSPNEQLGVALVGCGGMGRGDARNASRFGRVVALCDVDEARLGEAGGDYPQAKRHADFRQVMEQPGVDIVICGTVDHWHTLVSMAAVKAGKDVYCEKPLTLTIDEGKRLVQAVRDSNRILQTGSQQRSDARFRLACELVRNGRIGKVTHVTTFLPAGLRGGPFAPSEVPKGFNWDFWQGSTPAVDYVRERGHFSFRYWYDYSGGTMTDWGAHHNDIALWGLGLDGSGPVKIEGKPLVEMIPGGYTATSEYNIEYTYANGVTHTCRSTPDDQITGQPLKPDGQRHGVRFEGADGWIWVTRGAIEASDPDLLEAPLSSDAARLYRSDDHMGNFFECVRTREQPICNVEVGHRSVSVCHLGVIAMRLGRPLAWDPEKEQFVGDNEANGWIAREMRKPWDYEMI